jgi:hypothetical protein
LMLPFFFFIRFFLLSVILLNTENIFVFYQKNGKNSSKLFQNR